LTFTKILADCRRVRTVTTHALVHGKGKGQGRKRGQYAKESANLARLSGGRRQKTRGAAAATARKHGLDPANGPRQVKRFSALQVVRIFRSAGRPKGLTPEVEKKIADIIDEDDIQTYREAAEKLGLPKTALYKYATKDFDYCCLN
jgi:hypothetical protein